MNNKHGNDSTSGDHESIQQTPTTFSGSAVATLKRRSSLSANHPDQQRPASLATAATPDRQQTAKRRPVGGVWKSGAGQGGAGRIEAAAATTIQRAWRRRVLNGPVSQWKRENITAERLKSLSFEEATQLMQSPAIVQSSEALMHALLRTCSAPSHTADTGSNLSFKLPGRTFVVGHLFTAYPQLLVTDNSHIDALVESSAITMTQTYAQFAAAFTSHHAGWYQKQLASVASFKAFYAALDSWKRSDAKKLMLAMERHYLDLNQLWQSVQHQALGEGDKTWQAGIRGQQDDLLAKIRALGGDDAVEALTLSQREPQLSHSSTQSLPVPSQQPAAGGSASDTLQVSPLPSTVLAKAMSDPVSREVNRVLGNFDLTASAALQDAKLAHELVLDPGLRLEPAASNTLVGAVQQAVTKAFFAHIKQGIDQGNNDHVLGILTQLRLDMHTIVPPSSHQRETLDRELDPEWIATQLSNGALDVHAKFRLILQTARSVCAPIRDDTIDSLLDRLTAVDFSALANIHKAMGALSNEAKSNVGELLEITQEIMQLVRNVRLDALNHQLDVTVRPWLRIHIVEYEQTKMAQLLESQCQSDAQLIVAKTTGWMHAAATRESSAPCSLPTTAKHVFLEAVLDMCFAPVALSEEDTPVTWTLDRLRIQQLQNELQVLLSASALCALTKALAQNSGVQADTSRQNALELVSLLREDGVTMDRIIGMVQRITGSEEIMTDLVPKTLAKDDPVFRLMERQLRKFMLAELDKNEAPGLLARRLESNSQAISAALSSFSMSAVHKEVIEVLIRASRLCSLNWQVYSPWYTKTRLA